MEVRAERVTKRYGRAVTALDAVTCTLTGGSSYAVSGPSGSGKSTLLRLVAGLERPSRGRLRIDGRSPRKVRTVALVPQRLDLEPGHTALEAVVADRPGPHVRERASALLSSLSLTGSTRVRELSLGDQRRVAVARALVMGPRLLLADEPTANLDAGAAAGVVDLLLGTVQSGVLLVLATHDPDVAERCERTLTLAAGRLVDPR